MNIRGVASVTKMPCGEHAPHCQFLPMQALRGEGPETVCMFERWYSSGLDVLNNDATPRQGFTLASWRAIFQKGVD